MRVPRTKIPEEEPLLSKIPIHHAQSKSRRKLYRCKSAPAPVADFANANAEGATEQPLVPFQAIRDSTIIQASLIASIYLGVGTICFLSLNQELKGGKTNGAVDALYFSIVTMTTLGYGDLVPDGVSTKLLVCAYVLTGVTLMGVFLTAAANYLIEKQEKLLIKAFDAESKNDLDEFMKHDETKKTFEKIFPSLIIFMITFVLGIVILNLIEGLNILDSFYTVCCTITTLGFGDRSFQTELGRIFAIFWIPSSTACAGHFILHLAELITSARQQKLVHWVMKRQTTPSDIEAADMDADGALCRAEFVLYKLKEMGKIEDKDVALILKEFDYLDVDDSGKVTKSDLNFVQGMKNQDI